MRYTRYGITMHLMKEQDIEMVRQWRNDPVVVKNYQFREHITPEMQKNWFQTVNNVNNLYTIIEYQGEKIGVINMKNIDWENKTFETGIFIPYEKFHNTPVPAIVSFVTTEIPFIIMNWPLGFAHVMKENRTTQAFIKMLGYEKSPGQEDKENQEFRITREKFLEKRSKLRKAISVLVNDVNQPAMLIFEKAEMDDPVVKAWEEKAQQSLSIIKVEESDTERIYFLD